MAMTSRERVLAALRREEPDRVPHCELGIDRALAQKLMGWGEGDVTSYAYEYGNTFLFTAGLLNMLLVVDAFDISQGRKQ